MLKQYLMNLLLPKYSTIVIYTCGSFLAVKFIGNSTAWLYHFLKYHMAYRILNYLYPVSLKEKFGEWAVVTGCTSGIGKSFAQQLAKHGLNIILISRNQTKLENLAKQIEATYRVATTVIAVDFSQATGTTYETIENRIGDKQIGILVNNVGIHYDHPEYFESVSPKKLEELVNVNVSSATLMTRMLLPDMEKRRCGAIVNMSSSAGVMPNPLIAAYSATKAYVDVLSSSVELECESVSVITLIPFYISTGMTQYSSTLRRAPAALVPQAERYVSGHVLPILCRIPRGRGLRTTAYWAHTIQLWFSEMVPRWLWLRCSLMLHRRLRREGLKTHAE